MENTSIRGRVLSAIRLDTDTTTLLQIKATLPDLTQRQISNALSQLRLVGHVTCQGYGQWSLTETGRALRPWPSGKVEPKAEETPAKAPDQPALPSAPGSLGNAPSALDAALETFTQSLVDHLMARTVAVLGARIEQEVEVRIEARLADLLQRKAAELGKAALHSVQTPPAGVQVEGTVRGEPAHRLPNVVVIGLLNQQAEEIRKSFKDRANLRFYDANEIMKDSATRLADADVVAVMTKFISHKAYGVVRARHPNAIHCNGGVSGLRNELSLRLASLQARAA